MRLVYNCESLLHEVDLLCYHDVGNKIGAKSLIYHSKSKYFMIEFSVFRWSNSIMFLENLIEMTQVLKATIITNPFY